MPKKIRLIIHCYNDIHSENETKPGVIIEDFDKSNEWFGGDYYTHNSYQKDWILGMSTKVHLIRPIELVIRVKEELV